MSVIAAALLWFNGIAQAAEGLIQPAVVAYSSQNPANISRPAAATTDGSGLTAGPSGVLGEADSTHDNNPTPNMWTTTTYSDTNPYITYDLGAVYDLATTRIWNYNEAGFTQLGPSSILLSSSVDGTNFTSFLLIRPAKAGGGAAQAAQDFATPAAGIRYVRMQILTNWDGAIFWKSISGASSGGADGRFLTGLSEVRFVVSTTAPTISQQPQPVTAQAGSSATLTVVAADNGFPPLTYQWRRNGINLTNGTNISGATTPTLVIKSVLVADQGYYDVVVTNTKGTATSARVSLLIGGRLITPSIVAFSSEYNSGGNQRLVTNLVNGAGMSGPGYYYDTHDNGESDVWHRAAGDNSPFVIFDLGGLYNLVITRIWNLNQGQANERANGAKDVRVSVSTDGTNFTILGTNTLAEAGGTPAEPAQDIYTPAPAIRCVKIEPLNGYGGGWNGLSAVRFQADLPLSMDAGPYQPSIQSLRKHGYPDWFRDAKFGIWAHWGPQAVPMQGDWYARFMYNQGSSDYNYHVATYGHPSQMGYKDIIPLWKAERWDPDRLMDLYKKAGAKYFMSMGVHHDNFFMWNSKLHRWNAVNMGPQKDIVATWATAARKQGLRFGVSEHLGASKTWWTSSHGSDQSGPLAGVPYDGANPQYWDLYGTPCAPGDNGWFSSDPEWQYLWYNEIRELVENYDFDIIYSDGALPFGNEVGLSFVANLYNHRIAKAGADDVVVTIKQDCQGEWALDIEQGTAADISPYPWQTESSIGDWYYNQSWSYQGQKYRPTSWVLNRMVDVVSKNGNLLLNVVMRPDGSLDPEVETMLGQMADWIPIYGEGIYSTRPWKIFGEGPTTTTGGSFNQETIYCAQDIRYTTKAGTLYAFTLGWPADNQVTLKALGGISGSIESVSVLGYNGPVNWQRSAEALVVHLPAQQLSPFTACIKIVGDGLEPNSTIAPTDGGLPGKVNLTTGAGKTQVALNWTAALGATGYTVKRATKSGGPYTSIANSTNTVYRDAGLASGATYYYVVSATNSYGEGDNSSEASATVGQGVVLIRPSIRAFSSEYNSGNYQRLAANLTNGAGMSGPGYSYDTHDNGQSDVWHHASGDNNPFVVFDLGGCYNLAITRIWNLNQGGSTANGAKDVRISTSIDNVSFAMFGTTTLTQAGGTPTEPAQDFATAVSSVRYVKVEPLNGYGGGWNGLAAVRFEGTALPSLVTLPVGWTNQVGRTAVFTIGASSGGGGSLTYQWMKNGVKLSDGDNISGATTAQLTVANVTLANAGSYSVIVSYSGSALGVTSPPVNLQAVLVGLNLPESKKGGKVITPRISAFSSEYNSGANQRLAANLVNGAGMSGPGFFTDTHGNADSEVWHRAPGDANPFVTFDLGDTCNLLLTRIWNLNRAADTLNGTKDLRISVSSDNATFVVLGTNTLFQAAGTAAEPAQDFSTPAINIRYVKIEPLSGYSEANWNGLSAVRFVVTDSQQKLPLVSVKLQGVTGLHYQLERTAVLGQTDWEIVSDIPCLPGASLELPLFDGAATNHQAQGFYRAVWVP